jgi:hypothetical protein
VYAAATYGAGGSVHAVVLASLNATTGWVQWSRTWSGVRSDGELGLMFAANGSLVVRVPGPYPGGGTSFDSVYVFPPAAVGPSVAPTPSPSALGASPSRSYIPPSRTSTTTMTGSATASPWCFNCGRRSATPGPGEMVLPPFVIDLLVWSVLLSVAGVAVFHTWRANRMPMPHADAEAALVRSEHLTMACVLCLLGGAVGLLLTACYAYWYHRTYLPQQRHDRAAMQAQLRSEARTGVVLGPAAGAAVAAAAPAASERQVELTGLRGEGEGAEADLTALPVAGGAQP